MRRKAYFVHHTIPEENNQGPTCGVNDNTYYRQLHNISWCSRKTTLKALQSWRFIGLESVVTFLPIAKLRNREELERTQYLIIVTIFAQCTQYLIITTIFAQCTQYLIITTIFARCTQYLIIIFIFPQCKQYLRVITIFAQCTQYLIAISIFPQCTQYLIIITIFAGVELRP